MKFITDYAAKIAAKKLSYKLYYEDSFTTHSLRVFLDNLPKVAIVQFYLLMENGCYVFPSCTVRITFADSKFRPILIVLNSSWQFDNYWVDYRAVPVRYIIDGYIDPLPF